MPFHGQRRERPTVFDFVFAVPVFYFLKVCFALLHKQFLAACVVFGDFHRIFFFEKQPPGATFQAGRLALMKSLLFDGANNVVVNFNLCGLVLRVGVFSCVFADRC